MLSRALDLLILVFFSFPLFPSLTDFSVVIMIYFHFSSRFAYFFVKYLLILLDFLLLSLHLLTNIFHKTEHASLHVVIGATHCFDKTLVDTGAQCCFKEQMSWNSIFIGRNFLNCLLRHFLCGNSHSR
jgi:hypothetical protein